MQCFLSSGIWITFNPYTTERAILLNSEMLAILDDPLRSGPRLVSSNNYQVVFSRQLANGDVAVGFWNFNTNATTHFNVPLTNIPGVFTNRVFVTDVYDNAITTAYGDLTATVNTNGMNVYRLSSKPFPTSPTGLTRTFFDAATNAFVYRGGRLAEYLPFGLIGWWKLNDTA
jgi:hypothetical protein